MLCLAAYGVWGALKELVSARALGSCFVRPPTTLRLASSTALPLQRRSIAFDSEIQCQRMSYLEDSVFVVACTDTTVLLGPVVEVGEACVMYYRV